jgi:hypothetical protein
MHIHGIGFSLASGRRSHGGQHLEVSVDDQAAGRLALSPGEEHEITINGRVATLLAIASRNGVPDAEASLLINNERVANLNRGPLVWYEFGHLEIPVLDDGQQVDVITIRNDNERESCQIDYAIGFTPAEDTRPVVAEAATEEPVTPSAA